MQFFMEFPDDTQSKSYMLTLTVYVWEFQNNAFWDIHLHALFNYPSVSFYSWM